MKKRMLCIVLTLIMLFSLAACGSSKPAAEEPAKEEQAEPAPEEPAAEEPAETPAEPAPETPAAPEGSVTAFTNEGFTLNVPVEYEELLIIETPAGDEDGILFTVSEKASVEAAAAQGEEESIGAGWIFSIRTLDEETLNKRLCGDMSGEEAFGKDGNGMHFTLCHPTDVRFVRESYDDIDDDLAQWGMLHEWAATVPDSFISDNGLIEAKYSNTDLDMCLAGIAFEGDTGYTISTTEFGPLEPLDVDPAPYLERLRNNVTYEYEDAEAPDGEYVVLAFPDVNLRFDFFTYTEEGYYIREVNQDYEMLYKANVKDDSVNPTEVMQEWYDALAEANGKK